MQEQAKPGVGEPPKRGSAGVFPVKLRVSSQWASLQNFWCVSGRYLVRSGPADSSFNRVIGRQEDKNIKEKKGKRVIRWSDFPKNPNDQISQWLAGTRGESKRVFSFKDPTRTFGFVNPKIGLTFDEMQKRLQGAWGKKFQLDENLTYIFPL